MKEDKKYYFIATDKNSLYTIGNTYGFANKISELACKGEYLVKEENQYYIYKILRKTPMLTIRYSNKKELVHLKRVAYIGKEKQLTDKDVEELIFNKKLVEVPKELYDKELYLEKLKLTEEEKENDYENLVQEICVLHSKKFSFDDNFSIKDLEELQKTKQNQWEVERRNIDLLPTARKYLQEYISNEKETIMAQSFKIADKKFVYSIWKKIKRKFSEFKNS